MIVTRFFGMDRFDVPPAPMGVALPAGLVIPPGQYMPACPYDFSEPGLYQVWQPTTSDPCGVQWTSYRMVLGATPTPFVLATICAWANVFGWADWWPYRPGNPPDDYLCDKLMGYPVSMGGSGLPGQLLNLPCGPHAAFVKSRAQAAGIEFRYTHPLTNEVLNGFADGHVSMEMRRAGEPWLLYDPNLCGVYRDQDGNLLNLADAVTGFYLGTTVRDPIAPFRYGNGSRLGTYKVGTVTHGQFSSDAWGMDARLDTSAGLDAEVWRSYQLPFLERPNGQIVGYLPAGVILNRPLPTGYSLVDEADFRAEFYGPN